MIALLGSVFSPYYAWSGRHDPLNHAALNVVLYGRRGARWAMTERHRTAVDRSADRLAIGPSALDWDGTALTIRIDEVAVPLPRRIRGTVRVFPSALTDRRFALDRLGRAPQDAGGQADPGRHRWWPICPTARVEVALERPALAWHGAGYLDMNAGDEPLEAGFQRWDWSRADLSRPGQVPAAGILYDVWRRDGTTGSLAVAVAADGSTEALDPPPRARLPRTGWRIDRRTRSDADHPATVVETLEDTPFYARSVVAAGLTGRRVTAMHESLDLDRFARTWVRVLLPFRMPRTLR